MRPARAWDARLAGAGRGVRAQRHPVLVPACAPASRRPSGAAAGPPRQPCRPSAPSQRRIPGDAPPALRGPPRCRSLGPGARHSSPPAELHNRRRSRDRKQRAPRPAAAAPPGGAAREAPRARPAASPAPRGALPGWKAPGPAASRRRGRAPRRGGGRAPPSRAQQRTRRAAPRPRAARPRAACARPLAACARRDGAPAGAAQKVQAAGRRDLLVLQAAGRQPVVEAARPPAAHAHADRGVRAPPRRAGGRGLGLARRACGSGSCRKQPGAATQQAVPARPPPASRLRHGPPVCCRTPRRPAPPSPPPHPHPNPPGAATSCTMSPVPCSATARARSPPRAWTTRRSCGSTPTARRAAASASSASCAARGARRAAPPDGDWGAGLGREP
jgi:hypothetical protein